MFHVKPMIKGVIFDFNGTLYNDHDLHKRAWLEVFFSVKPNDSKVEINYENLERTVFNDYQAGEAIYNMLGIKASEQEIAELSNKKERIYNRLAKELNRKDLIKGVSEFLDYLKDHKIPYCIASMATKGNFDQYLDYLHLNRWFDYKNIVYAGSAYPNKNTQILEAAKRMNLDPKDCLMVEDSARNIKQASESLGMDKFIYINTTNTEFKFDGILQEAEDFQNINYQIFEK